MSLYSWSWFYCVACLLGCYMQTIRLARCYKSKLKAVCDGLQQLRRFSHVDPAVLSTLCLELFVNAILLDLLIRKPSVALRHFDQARVSLESTSAASFKGMFMGCVVGKGRLVVVIWHPNWSPPLAISIQGAVICWYLPQYSYSNCSVK